MRMFFFATALLCLSASCNPKQAAGEDTGAKFVWALGGLAAGAAMGMCLPRRRKPVAAPAGKTGLTQPGMVALEQKLFEAEDLLKAEQHRCRELQRQLSEAQKLAGTPAPDRAVPAPDARPGSAGAEAAPDSVPAAGTRLYYMQPTAEGRFPESGRTDSAENAVYALTVDTADQHTATLCFIDTAENVQLALKHESAWLLVACERSNRHTPATRSIITETAGRVLWQDDAWQIVEKARIRYQ